MDLLIRKESGVMFAEVSAEEIVVYTAKDGLHLLGNVHYQGHDKLLIRKEHLCEPFFDLSTGLAGEILQKFSNYRIRLAIWGDFSELTRPSIRDFMRESNRQGHVSFVDTRELAVQALTA
ncbi:MAG: DUF4180 domain-containing protein [Bacteroidota bacterium]